MAMIRTLVLALLGISLSVILAGCSTVRTTVFTGSCLGLIEGTSLDLRTSPVPAAPLPEGDSQGEWVANADAQVGRLDTANRNGAAGLSVIAKCEERDKKAAERLSGPFWRRWFGG